ncbi:ATP-binding protein [Nostoc sp. C117]|uniref:ATP-binding protein n=1 Tax=Nostoc sp. C117 TaxID=3349875 RepID=UPI00370D951A
MTVSFTNIIAKIASVDLFKRNTNTGNIETGIFIGRPFHIDYEKAYILVADSWKLKAKGIPQGSFLLAYYENEDNVYEVLLLRVVKPAKLPTDNDVISSMIEYYKDNLKTNGKESQLDSYTKYEFSFSGLECRILGTFYKDDKGYTRFGADVENFYSAHNYRVIKPNPDVLELIVNFREEGITGKPTDIKIGKVRYSSSLRFQAQEDDVPVFVSPKDFLGKRTALFGMTRTGKSNTVKKVIQATVLMSDKAAYALNSKLNGTAAENLEPLTDDGLPKYPVGQIIFDINGEYANANMQDEGTAIFEIYRERTIRYSTLNKDGFKVMKVNFYRDVESGFELIRSHLGLETADYVKSFLSIDLQELKDKTDFSATTRYERKKAAYLCCLYKAGFIVPDNFKVKFDGRKELNQLVKEDESIDPSKGISLEEASNWFTTIWENYNNDFFSKYKKDKGHEWADEDLKALLIFLTRKTQPTGKATINGYIKLRDIAILHTETVGKPFEEEIIEELRKGQIIIVDLSQGDPEIQRLYSERICRQIFADAMNRFIHNISNNFIQFYFEEAHNLFPKKDDKDLSQVYNRIAKEGAKLNLGLIYATQEVSSISSNILKNTQNWFIAHLNNEDETKEIKKYYDFGDFTESLVRFSADSDKGFVRMKTYSNAFVVPTQIDRFSK